MKKFTLAVIAFAVLLAGVSSASSGAVEEPSLVSRGAIEPMMVEGTEARARGARGKLVIPKLKPPVPLVLTYPDGRDRTISTARRQVLVLPQGLYVLSVKRPLRGFTVSLPNSGSVYVKAGERSSVAMKTVRNVASLTVSVVNTPGDARPRIVVSSRGYRKVIQSTTTLRGLPAGVYSIVADGLTVGQRVRIPNVSEPRLRLDGGDRARVVVDFRNEAPPQTVTDTTGVDLEVTAPAAGQPGYDGSIVIQSPGAATAKVGDPVVLQSSPLLPGGYVGRVTEVSGRTVTAVPASPYEIFPDLQVRLALDNATYQQAVKDSLSRANPRNVSFGCTGSLATAFSASGVELSMPLGRSFVHWDEGTPSHVRLETVISARPQREIQLSASGSCEGTLSVAIPAGFPGLYIEPSLGLGATAEVSQAFDVASPAAMLPFVSVTTGFEYKDGSLEMIWNPAGEPNFSDGNLPEFTLAVGPKGSVAVKAGVIIDGFLVKAEATAGAGVELDVALKFTAPADSPAGQECLADKDLTATSSLFLRLTGELGLFEGAVDILNQKIYEGTVELPKVGCQPANSPDPLVPAPPAPTPTLERSACDFSIRFSPSGTISDSLPRPALRKIQACADELKRVGGGSYVSYSSTRMGAAAMIVVSEIEARGGQAYPIPQDFCPANRVCVNLARAY